MKNRYSFKLNTVVTCSFYTTNERAPVPVNDTGITTASRLGAAGEATTVASENSLALCVDADYNAIDTSKFTLSLAYENNDNYSCGIFEFGVETYAKTYVQYSNAYGLITLSELPYVIGAYKLGMLSFLAANGSSHGTLAFGINSNIYSQRM